MNEPTGKVGAASLAAGGPVGPLHGVPLAREDMFYRAGVGCTCGSKIRRAFVPDRTATVLRRLDAAGALDVGGLDLPEFAHGPTGHNAHFGACRNASAPRFELRPPALTLPHRAADARTRRDPHPFSSNVLTLHVCSTRVHAMDVAFVLQGIAFVWDDDKARANPRHHDGITFEQAAEAFFDPFLKVVDASRNEEVRHAVIGMDTRWNLLFVVHIEVEDEAIRLISARGATRRERAEYEA